MAAPALGRAQELQASDHSETVMVAVCLLARLMPTPNQTDPVSAEISLPLPPEPLFSPPQEATYDAEGQPDMDALTWAARDRLEAAGVPLPQLSYLMDDAVIPQASKKEVPPPAETGLADAARLAEEAKFAAEKKKRVKAKAAKRRMVTEVPLWAAVAGVTAAMLTVLGFLPPFSVRGILLAVRPPGLVIQMLSRSVLHFESEWVLPILIGVVAGALCVFLESGSKIKKVTFRIGRMLWDRNNFCRGWLITGGTGCGKTACAIMWLFHQLFQNERGRRAEPAAKGVIPADQPVDEAKEAKAKEAWERYQEAYSLWQARKTQAEFAGQRFMENPPKAISPLLPRENPLEVRYIEQPWGGVCIDEKGLFHERLSGLCAHYNRTHHLMLLKTRPDGAPENWVPEQRFNLLSGDHIPSNTYAKNIVRTAQQVEGSGGGGGGNQFFVSSAQIGIGWGIELCRAIMGREKEVLKKERKDCYYPSLTRVSEILSSEEFYKELLADRGVMQKGKGTGKEKTEGGNTTPKVVMGPLLRGVEQPKHLWSPALVRLDTALNHFRLRYWNLPKETLGGVQGTINTYLNYFNNPEVADVFCADNTFEFEQIDQGMILCVAMPQKLQTERQYVCTLLKLLFYTHVLRRFDRTKQEFENKNLLVIWQDEAQRFITEADGNVDVIREAGATTVIACQSKTSLYPPLGGKEKATVTILNLRNRFIFKAADEECATGSAEFLGKHRKKKVSRTTGKGGGSRSYSEEIAFKIEPFELREIKDLHAIVCHPDGKWRKMLVEPQDEQGNLPGWYNRPISLQMKGMFLKAFTGRDH